MHDKYQLADPHRRSRTGERPGARGAGRGPGSADRRGLHAEGSARDVLEAQRRWLPNFAGKQITPKPTIVIPADCQPVEVPLDPALAIGKRFGTLIQQG